MRVGAVSHAHWELPPVPAPAPAHGDVRHSDAVAARLAGRRPATVRELAQPRNRGEHLPAHPAVARIAWHDAEPVAGTLARFPFVLVQDRERTDDPQPWHAREDRRSTGCWPEPFLYSGVERRDRARRPLYSGTSAVPAAARLDSVAGHSQKVAGDQRARQYEPTGSSATAAAGCASRPWASKASGGSAGARCGCQSLSWLSRVSLFA